MNMPDILTSDHFYPRDLVADSGLPFDERRRILLESSTAFLEHHQGLIRDKHRAGASGRTVVGSLTSMADTLVRNLYRGVSADLGEDGLRSCTLVALGGYGRAELNPRSDIDILFFCSEKEKKWGELISERMLYLLWDLGLDIGHSVRTASDCLEMINKDITARTALLDSRYLIGDEVLYGEFTQKVLGTAIMKNSSEFIREKLEERDRRLHKYGSSVYLLEPNIKEGEGGLRDLHSALWIARIKYKAGSVRELIVKGVLTEKEGEEFERSFDYLWRIRNELHYLSGRKNDQIHFDQQEKIAQFLNYRDSRKAPAVEQFMQDYYSHGTRVEHISSSLIGKATYQEEPALKIMGYLSRRFVDDGFYVLRGELRVGREDIFAEDPTRMMKAFLLAQRHQVELSFHLKGLIRENLRLINDRVRRSRAMSDAFRDILRYPRGVAKTLKDMHHLQFLTRFIPEFNRIYCKVQHDAYHIYTVDIHSLFAVEEIEKLRRGDYRGKKPLLTRVANDVEKLELLHLAVLLHDIGKGEGKDHSNKGADMIPTIARRLGLNREDSRRLEFLVRNHLIMAHISQRRDLHDDKLIIQFARSMEMSENLKMLFLLTFADLKAVGPDVWSEWKGFLLMELYEKAYDVLERSDFQLEKRSEKVRNRKKKVIGILTGEFGARTIKDVLKVMSTRYLLSHRSTDIADHIRLILSRRNQSVVMEVEHEPEGEYTQVVISTLDIPGLFSKVAGVMAANGVNIMGAQIYTQSNGVTLDILQVKSPAGEIIDDEEKWRSVREDLASVIEGRARVDNLVRKRRDSSLLPQQARPRFSNRVEIDNDVSDEYTVVDVFANDKVGLLYQITKALKELGLYIGVSRISTKVDQVIDTFYLQDIFGQKITQPEKLEELKKGVLESLEAY